jgi:hypothetical protein
MFHVTIRTLRKVCCRCGGACSGDVGEGLFASLDECEDSGPCGRSACSRVNRAVQNVAMSAVLLVFVALKGAPGRDEPASGDEDGSALGRRCIEDVEACRVSVRESRVSCERTRNAWIRNKVGHAKATNYIIS